MNSSHGGGAADLLLSMTGAASLRTPPNSGLKQMLRPGTLGRPVAIGNGALRDREQRGRSSQ